MAELASVTDKPAMKLVGPPGASADEAASITDKPARKLAVELGVSMADPASDTETANTTVAVAESTVETVSVVETLLTTGE